MNPRVLSRVVIYNPDTKKILLAKNKGADFWYAPGGGWEYEKENILECAKREVREEAGIDVDIKRLLYVQEFHATEDTIFFELFWLGIPHPEQEVNKEHQDKHGEVEMVKWYTQEEVQDLKVFPKRLKNTFWENVTKLLEEEDPFIGVN